MKGYAAGSATGAKRRWRGPSMVVPALVILSLLVPLAFLLGLHNRFPAGFSNDDRQASESSFGTYGHVDAGRRFHEDDQARINNLMKKLGHTVSKDVTEKITREAKKMVGEKTKSGSISSGMQLSSQPEESTFQSQPKDITSGSETKDSSPHPKGLPSPDQPTSKPVPVLGARVRHYSGLRKVGGVGTGERVKGSNSEESERSCQLEFGSYCLWSLEHKEVMKDSTVKRLKDQLFVARAYFPSIAKLQAQEKLSRELKQNIQEHERMLSEAIVDSDLPQFVGRSIQKMDQTIARAKSCTVDCNNIDKKLRQILDLTEDEAHFHMKQSAFMYGLGVQTMHKSLHCLTMRLTVEYFRSPSVDTDHVHANNLYSPIFRHHVIFSRNILAASVVINSTVMNSEETKDMVFHLLTDVQNYYAMKLWFARNSYKEAVINVLNFDQLNHNLYYNLGLAQLSLPEEFRVSIRDVDQPPPAQIRTQYISVFGHSHFLLPELFKNLRKIVVLDDDVVVQQDLSPLWNLDLEGKVNGAVELCGVRLGQLKSHLGGSSYDGNSCLWMSGLNIVDLEKWREYNITGIYQEHMQKLQSQSEASWRAATLPVSLLVFQGLIYPLDGSWVLSGLGHDYWVSEDSIKNTAALHYNGNMKPWLDLGILKYKKIWKQYLLKEERFMDECNVNP